LFKTGCSDFIIVNVHIYYSNGSAGKEEREKEIHNIVNDIHKMSNAEDNCTFDRNIFIVGNFNIAKYTDKFFNALTSKKFKIPEGLNSTKTNLRQTVTYDKIAWVPRKSFKFAGNFRVVPFNLATYKDIPLRKLENIMSGHLLLWAAFQIKKLEQKLYDALK
jgi:hypothetical protein